MRVAEGDGVTVGLVVGEGVAEGEGQFCCSCSASSPTGPSSLEPMFADSAMQAMIGSH